MRRRPQCRHAGSERTSNAISQWALPLWLQRKRRVALTTRGRAGVRSTGNRPLAPQAERREPTIRGPHRRPRGVRRTVDSPYIATPGGRSASCRPSNGGDWKECTRERCGKGSTAEWRAARGDVSGASENAAAALPGSGRDRRRRPDYSTKHERHFRASGFLRPFAVSTATNCPSNPTNPSSSITIASESRCLSM